MRRTSEGADGALRPRLWGIFARLLLFVLSTNVFGAANSGITVQVSRETAPPGGYAQFKVLLTAPALVSQASISMSFDPTIFGPVASVAAFSATGDQTGQSHLEGQKVGAAYLFRPSRQVVSSQQIKAAKFELVPILRAGALPESGTPTPETS